MLPLAKPDMAAAACGSLEQILPETTPWNPIINDSIPWSSAFNPESKKNESWRASTYSSDSNGGVCVMNSESLQLCTEGLGFESLDDVEDLKNEASCSRLTTMPTTSVSGQPRSHVRCEQEKRSFPPPITGLGRAGEGSSVCFKSYRQDGRFVLQEVRIPTQQRRFHACREDGRLRLSFIQPGDDDVDGGEEDNEGKEVGLEDD